MSGTTKRVPREALRDNADTARVERVWRRLRSDLGEPRPRQKLSIVWLPAAFALVFAAGVYVGSKNDPASVSTTRLAPEPAGAVDRSTQVDPPRPTVPEPVPPKREKVKRHRSVRRVPQTKGTSSALEPSVPVLPVTEPEAGQRAESAEWQQLAGLGEYERARQAIDAAGGFDAIVPEASAEQLMTLADIARATDQRGRAIQALRQVTERHAEDPNAPVAAMLLGNMLDRAGDKAGAAQAFELNRRLSPKGDLAEDALVRQFEMALEQGKLEQANSLVAQYEKDFPDGRRLYELRERLLKAEDVARAGSERGVEADSSESVEDSSAP